MTVREIALALLLATALGWLGLLLLRQRGRVSWRADDPLPGVPPVRLAEQLMFAGGRRAAAAPINEAIALEAALARPATTRVPLDFDHDGYVIRGCLDKQPGPWQPIPEGAPAAAVEVLVPPDEEGT